MNKLATLFIAISLCLSVNALLSANQETEYPLGEKLVRQLWADIKQEKMNEVEKRMARGFQSVYANGARNREQEIELIKGLKLGDYTLTDINATQNGDIVVVTYSVTVEETIEGKRVAVKSAPRLSVFVKTDSGWQLIAHANLNPPK